ncbi:MAG: MFS transporter [Christensenellales bacterium]|jgi:sugar (glycoside-pentoside-hexuronide) transporter
MTTKAAAFKGKLSEFAHKLFGTTPGTGLQPKEAIAYSITGFGQNLICTMIGSYLTIFMTDALGFDLNATIGATTGIMAVAYLMLATRIFDALNDPIMGSVVDKTRTKWGKCRPYLKWMAVPIGVMTLLCFLPFYKTNLASFLVLSFIYVAWSVIYTIADVPYWALSTAMENDTEKRGKFLTVARLACTGGAGLVTILIPAITDAVTKRYKINSGHIGKTIEGIGVIDASHINLVLPEFAAQNAATLRWTYFICTLVIVLIALPMFFYGFKNTKERFQTTDKPASFGHNIKLLFKNNQLMLIVISGVLGAARMVYMYTGGLYFCKYALRNEGLFGLLTMLVIPGGVIASVLVPWFTKRFSKKWTFIGSHLLGAVAMLVMYLVGWQTTGGMVVAVIAMIILGIPQGFSNIMTYALIGDTVDYLEWKTGERAEGICFAMQTLINKIGMAVGAFIGVIAYGMSGISPANPAGSMTDEGLKKLWDMLVLSGVVSMFACVVPMFFYTFTEKKQKEAIAEVMARKVAVDPTLVLDYAGDIEAMSKYLDEETMAKVQEIRLQGKVEASEKIEEAVEGNNETTEE